jgi:hypothetical protein
MDTFNEYDLIDILEDADEETLRHMGFLSEVEYVDVDDDWTEDIDF